MMILKRQATDCNLPFLFFKRYKLKDADFIEHLYKIRFSHEEFALYLPHVDV